MCFTRPVSNAPDVSRNNTSMLLTPAEAMAELRVSKATLYKLLGVGDAEGPKEIESFLLAPNARRIPRASLEEYVKRKVAAAQGESPADAA